MRKLGKPLVWSLVGALVGVVISQVAVHTAGLAQAVLLSNEENTISIVRRYASSVVFITAEEMGSGFVLDREGHILTDSHVVGSALQITVQFRDGSTQLAELVSTDARTDLALLQVAELPAGVEPVVLGDSATLEVGQKVVLIGNPFGASFAVSEGIVSALERLVPETGQTFLQTDAALNPGSSGAPLFNSQGEVIGVGAGGITGPDGAFNGVGLAVPVNALRAVLPALLAGSLSREQQVPTAAPQTVLPSTSSLARLQARLQPQRTMPARVQLGVIGIDLTPERARVLGLAVAEGIVVEEVQPGQLGGRLGLVGGSRPVTLEGESFLAGGDVIVALNDQPVARVDELLPLLNRTVPGQVLTLTIVRGRRTMQLSTSL